MNKILLAFVLLVAGLSPAAAFGLNIELREYKDRVCYDGDTCYIIIKALPKKLEKMSVRILGIDTPEIRGKCAEEKELAIKARVFANKAFRSANKIEFKKILSNEGFFLKITKAVAELPLPHESVSPTPASKVLIKNLSSEPCL